MENLTSHCDTDTTGSSRKIWRWALPATTSMSLLALVALAVGGLDVTFVVCVVGIAAAVTGLFTWLYGGNGFLALALANFLALYACLFDFFAEVNYVTATEYIIDISFFAPIAAFLAGTLWFRNGVHATMSADPTEANKWNWRGIIWSLPSTVLIAAAFGLPVASFEMTAVNVLFTATIFLLSLTVFALSRSISVFMLRTARLFEALFRRIGSQLQAMFVFLTFYSLIIILFACLYRIIDLYSSTHHFVVGGELRDLTFLDSLYFSIISLSTVGYGDINPVTDEVRALVAIQTISGVLLMLFGFSEIMRHASNRQQDAGAPSKVIDETSEVLE